MPAEPTHAERNRSATDSPDALGRHKAGTRPAPITPEHPTTCGHKCGDALRENRPDRRQCARHSRRALITQRHMERLHPRRPDRATTFGHAEVVVDHVFRRQPVTRGRLQVLRDRQVTCGAAALACSRQASWPSGGTTLSIRRNFRGRVSRSAGRPRLMGACGHRGRPLGRSIDDQRHRSDVHFARRLLRRAPKLDRPPRPGGLHGRPRRARLLPGHPLGHRRHGVAGAAGLRRR